jgi:hypothetical protein
MQPAKATASAQGPAAGLSAEEARFQRNMKILVAVLGVLIFAGFATIAGRIIYLASSGETQPRGEIFRRPKPPEAVVANPPASAAAPAAGASRAAEPLAALPVLDETIQLQLPAGAEVRSVTMSGRQLAVHHVAPSGEGITVIDLGSGKVIARVALDRGQPGD